MLEWGNIPVHVQRRGGCLAWSDGDLNGHVWAMGRACKGALETRHLVLTTKAYSNEWRSSSPV